MGLCNRALFRRQRMSKRRIRKIMLKPARPPTTPPTTARVAGVRPPPPDPATAPGVAVEEADAPLPVPPAPPEPPAPPVVSPEVIVGLRARVSDGCETLEVVSEDGGEVLLLEVELGFELDVKLDVEDLWRDDDSELLLRLDEADVLDAVKVVEVVVVVDSVDGVPEWMRDDCESVEIVRLGLEELLSVLAAVVLV